MKKIYLKLVASGLSIITAFTMVIGATYAWMTLSQSPVVNGINVTIGGGRTIMLAPDCTKKVKDAEGEESIVHYPGAFDSTLDISQWESYAYLKDLAGLSPVSTADGLYWMVPVYDEETGELRPIEDFLVDKTLENGNVTAKKTGSYIYLDFWMVSPASSYEIRVSTDTRTKTGSFLKELPGVTASEDESLQLEETAGITEAIARVGFLVNTDTAPEEAMSAYLSSEDHNKHYKSLLGVYQEKGQEPSGDFQFAIYEPNGLTHPSEDFQEGDYVITNPLSYNPYGDVIMEQDIRDRLMLQEKSEWIDWGNSSRLEQMFQSFVINKKELSPTEAEHSFYGEQLKGQIGSYVRSGGFYKNVGALYEKAQEGAITADQMNLMLAGATDDAKITSLQPNTPQRVRMYIWLEGQDADCTNTASVDAGTFALNIELAGADE